MKKTSTAAWVPGAFEIPLVTAASNGENSGKYDAIICCRLQLSEGHTTHYDYVCNEVSKGVAQVGFR